MPEFGNTAKETLYEHDAPAYNRGELGRSTHTYTTVLPHEAVAKSLEQDPGWLDGVAGVC